MPSGAKIGGVNPGTIVIKVRKKVARIFQIGLTGDGYIAGGDLYVAVDNNNPTTWTNVGAIRDPKAKGFLVTGFRDILICGLLVIPVVDLPVNRSLVTASGIYWLYWFLGSLVNKVTGYGA